MKLVELELSGFRGFPKAQVFNLDADAIVLVGTNGNGKTSLFDGVLWALCGRVPRLAGDGQGVVSLYAESGQARAVLTLRDWAGETLRITRSIAGDGSESRISVQTPNSILSGPAAEGELIKSIWGEAVMAADPQAALASVLTHSVYLQQDTLRQFIDSDSDQERFNSVGELFGAGRVTELQVALERAKKAWSTATNLRASELETTQNTLASLEVRLRDFTARASQELPPIDGATWSNWWQRCGAAGVKTAASEFASRDSSRAIDSAIKEIDTRRAAVERLLQTLNSLRAQLAALKPTTPDEDLAKLRTERAARVDDIATLKNQVGVEQSRLAEFRRMQTELKQRDEQLRVLATMALKHMGEKCPVCGQDHDQEATRRHLNELLRTGSGSTTPEPDAVRLNELLSAVATKEKERDAIELAIGSAERSAAEVVSLRKSVSARLAEVGFGGQAGEAGLESLSAAVAETEKLFENLRSLQREGEGFALRLAQSALQASLVETQNEAERLRRSLAEQRNVVASRNATGETAQRVIEGLREAAASVVEQRLHEIAPRLQDIYSRIDPHPAFATVAFFSRVANKRGLLSTVVKDTIENKECPHPASVLSSSQVNALAVSVFLAFNLGIARPPLASLLLDDPLQSLDDVNLLGLVDLLRRTKDRRQLFVSTHDSRFASLLARKLRPSGTNGRTIVIELEGWHRAGPFVDVREVKSDPVPHRLAVAS